MARLLDRLLEDGLSKQSEQQRKRNQVASILDGVATSAHLELYRACKEGDLRRVKAILADSHVLAAVRDDPLKDNHSSALFEACHGNHRAIVRFLLDLGVDADAGNVWGCSPLYLAAQHNLYEIVDMLLDAGADVNKTAADKVTPMLVAAQWGNVKVMTRLAAAGADASLADLYGTTVESCANTNRKVARWLMETRGFNKLHHACAIPLQARAIAAILRSDGNAGIVNQQSKAGLTPLDVLLYKSNSSIHQLRERKDVIQLLKQAAAPHGKENHHLFPKSFRAVFRDTLKLSLLSKLRHRKKLRSAKESDVMQGLTELPTEVVEKVFEYCGRDWFNTQ